MIQSVGNLVASFADPPPNRKFNLDLGLKDQPKDIQDKHYKVITHSNNSNQCWFLAIINDILMQSELSRIIFIGNTAQSTEGIKIWSENDFCACEKVLRR